MRLLAGIVLLAGPCALSAPTQRPNIIVLLTDDQHYQSLGCMGNSQVRTPNLDRLASLGVTFDSHYCSTSICMASRASLMTGLYEYRTGCNFSHGALSRPKWNRSYPVMLRNAGYFTGFLGKFGFAVTDDGQDANYHTDDKLPMASFDVWKGWPGQGSYATAENGFLADYAATHPHVTTALGAAAQDFIRAAVRTGKPFCLSVSYKAPHGPTTPDPQFDSVYAETKWVFPPNYGEAGATHLPEQPKRGRQYRSINRAYFPDRYRKSLRDYHQVLYGVDVSVGMIVAELARQEAAEDTIIIFTTDNGYSLGAHDLGGKVLPYEEPSRAPLIIYDPRRGTRGARCRAVTGIIDMMPTICDAAGIPRPEDLDGRSLLPLLDDPRGRVRDAIALMNVWGNSPTHELAIVTEQYKYIHWFFAEGMEPDEELYHLTADPYEMANVAGDPRHRDALSQMRRHYDARARHWREACVDGSGYPKYGILLDRTMPWEQKLAALEARERDKFLSKTGEDEQKPGLSDAEKNALRKQRKQFPRGSAEYKALTDRIRGR